MNACAAVGGGGYRKYGESMSKIQMHEEACLYIDDRVEKI